MTDNLGRKIDYLRISVTDRCNLNCIYCVPEKKQERSNPLTTNEIVRICRIFSNLGISKIKITGGEPLLRNDICEIIQGIRALPEIKSTTLTTNGILFGDIGENLLKSGLDSINFSLDSTDATDFLKITGCNKASEVLESIKKALLLGFKSVKINFTAIRELNESQIIPITQLAKKYPVSVRFIELMPIGYGKKFTPIYTEKIKLTLENSFGIPKKLNVQGNGPAQYFQYDGFAGKIGFISPLSNPFCQSCNKVRIDSQGALILCLGHKNSLNIRELLKSCPSDSQIAKLIEEKIRKKPINHDFFKEIPNENKMHHIGG